MAYELIVSDPANRELDNAIGYIAVTLAAPGAATSLLEEYESALRLVADNPLLFGVDLYVSEAIGRQVRRCPVKRYGMYFTVDEDAGKIYIVAFTHSLRDTPRILSERLPE